MFVRISTYCGKVCAGSTPNVSTHGPAPTKENPVALLTKLQADAFQQPGTPKAGDGRKLDMRVRRHAVKSLG